VQPRIQFPLSGTVNGPVSFTGTVTAQALHVSPNPGGGILNIDPSAAFNWDGFFGVITTPGSNIVWTNGTNEQWASGSTLTGFTGSTFTFNSGSIVTFNNTPAFNAGLTFGGGTLNSYDTGTFTPGATGSGGTAGTLALSGVLGRWVKIGKLVHVSLTFTVATLGSYTGTFIVTGLPFTASAQGQVFPGSAGLQNVTFNGTAVPNVNANATTLNFWQVVSGTALTFLNWTGIVAGSFVNVDLTYETDS
jgi:hypothetical protein